MSGNPSPRGDRRLSRRQLLLIGSSALGGSALAEFLAACGGSTSPSTPTAAAGVTPSSQAPTTQATTAQATTAAAPTTASSTAASPTPKTGGRVVVGSIQEPEILNPWLAASTVALEVLNMIYDSLTIVDPDGNHVPLLATEVPTIENGGISSDFTQYTYKLRNDVKWHDGTPFTADDVVFTYQAVMDPKANVPGRYDLGQVASVQTPDPYTVVFKLKQPDAVFLESWTTGILPKHVFAGQDFNTTPINRAPKVGTGAYKFVEWRSGDRITVQRNDTYYRGGAYLDGIDYLIIPDSNALLSRIQTGELDMRFVLTAEQVPTVQGFSSYTVHSTPAYSYFHFTINNTDPVMSDKAVRQALTYGLDKMTITSTVLKGLDKPHWSPVAQPSWAFWDPPTKMDFNLDKANQLLDSAGWTMGSDGVRAKAGQRLSIDIMNISGDTERAQVVQLAQAMWKKIGVAANIKVVDLATFVKNSSNHQFQIAYGFWGYSVDPVAYNSRWLSTSPSNYDQYKNPQVDKLLLNAQATNDRNMRKPLYQQFQQIVIDDATNIYVYNRNFFDVVKKRVQGFSPNPGGANMWNVYQWWVTG